MNPVRPQSAAAQAGLLAPLPVLQGRRVVLRPMRADDITEQHVLWLNDPEVVRYSNQRFVRHTRIGCLQYLAGFEGSPNLYASIRLPDPDGTGESRIGTITGYRNPYHGTADMGILMGDRAVWGQGLGRDAFCTLADWLALQPGMRKITCGTLASNLAMLQVAHAAGFVREAVRTAQELVDGQATDLVLFARFC